MVQRVVIGTMVHGHEDGERLELKPGDVIDTDDLGLEEEDVARLDASGAFRARRDTAVQDDNVTENRSGRARSRRAAQPKSRYESSDGDDL